ncbi:MAG: hypothetical protein O3B87_05315 [bacterium]|nr:hypothetical protein [bacterium]
MKFNRIKAKLLNPSRKLLVTFICLASILILVGGGVYASLSKNTLQETLAQTYDNAVQLFTDLTPTNTPSPTPSLTPTSTPTPTLVPTNTPIPTTKPTSSIPSDFILVTMGKMSG